MREDAVISGLIRLLRLIINREAPGVVPGDCPIRPCPKTAKHWFYPCCRTHTDSLLIVIIIITQRRIRTLLVLYLANTCSTKIEASHMIIWTVAGCPIVKRLSIKKKRRKGVFFLLSFSVNGDPLNQKTIRLVWPVPLPHTFPISHLFWTSANYLSFFLSLCSRSSTFLPLSSFHSFSFPPT